MWVTRFIDLPENSFLDRRMNGMEWTFVCLWKVGPLLDEAEELTWAPWTADLGQKCKERQESLDARIREMCPGCVRACVADALSRSLIHSLTHSHPLTHSLTHLLASPHNTR